MIPNTPPYIPFSMRDIALIIGNDNARILMDIYGGLRLYIPSNIDAKTGKHLIGDIGKKAALKLCHNFGGEYIDIPKGTNNKKGDIIDLDGYHIKVLEFKGTYMKADMASFVYELKKKQADRYI